MQMALCKISATNAVTESVKLYDFKETPQCYIIDKQNEFMGKDTRMAKNIKDKIEYATVPGMNSPIILKVWCFDTDIKISQGALRQKLWAILDTHNNNTNILMTSFKNLPQ